MRVAAAQPKVPTRKVKPHFVPPKREFDYEKPQRPQAKVGFGTHFYAPGEDPWYGSSTPRYAHSCCHDVQVLTPFPPRPLCVPSLRKVEEGNEPFLANPARDVSLQREALRQAIADAGCVEELGFGMHQWFHADDQVDDDGRVYRTGLRYSLPPPPAPEAVSAASQAYVQEYVCMWHTPQTVGLA